MRTSRGKLTGIAHLILTCEERNGYRGTCACGFLAFTEDFIIKPRMTTTCPRPFAGLVFPPQPTVEFPSFFYRTDTTRRKRWRSA
jgi:hypothetical protein